MSRFLVCLIIVVGAVLDNVQSKSVETFECPKDGNFPHPKQCDKYYKCQKGKAKQLLCPDGLVFDDQTRLVNLQCNRPFNVKCGNRTELQEPKGTNEKCPRRNGVFAHPDSSICDVFYNCIEDDPVEMKCTAGLHFDSKTANCVWPDSANREGCKTAEKQKVVSGEFECPGESVKDENGQINPHPKYANPENCEQFFLCLNGVEKRQLSCDKGEVFNEETTQCDEPKNVPGCEDFVAPERIDRE